LVRLAVVSHRPARFAAVAALWQWLNAYTPIRGLSRSDAARTGGRIFGTL